MINYCPCSLDSQTDKFGTFTRGARTWPHRLQAKLQALGIDVACANFGLSGDTTKGYLDRMHYAFRYAGGPWRDPAKVDYTDLGLNPQAMTITYGGVNDIQGIAGWSQATTQKNFETILMCYKHGAFGAWENAGAGRGISPTGPCYVADVPSLPADARIGQRCAVQTDTEPGNGVTPAPSLIAAGLAVTPVGPPASNAVPTIWQYVTGKSGKLGWSRAVNSGATPPTWCSHNVIIDTNLLNWAANGDVPLPNAVPTNAPYSSYSQIRAAAAAAVAAQQNPDASARAINPWAVLVRLYAYQANLITSGIVPDWSQTAYDSTQDWHYAAANQHHGLYGHMIVTEAILDPAYGIPAAVLTQWAKEIA